MRRKGQVAIEFLMTYGWALMIVLITLSSLYFFVINPRSVVSPSCSFSGDLYCLGHKFNGSGLYVELKNNAGIPLNITNIFCEFEGVNVNNTLNVRLLPGGSSPNIFCAYVDLISDDLVRANVIVYFVVDGFVFPRSSEGEVIGYVD